MLGVELTNRRHRHILGCILLLSVVLIWVASAELTRYIFDNQKFDKPFFSTYLKTSMLMIYLLGFLMFKQWRYKCKSRPEIEIQSTFVSSDEEPTLTDPVFVPIKYDNRNSSTDTSLEFISVENMQSNSFDKRVKFNPLSEVRCLTESIAEDASIARMSYEAYQQIQSTRIRNSSSFAVKKVAKLSSIFFLLFFLGQFSYQEALKETQAGVVTILSSTSSMFTLILSAIFPSSPNDKFTLSKFFSTLLSITGVVIVSMSDLKLNMSTGVSLGIMWSLLGAIMYASYLVLLRRKVDHEDKLNVPMFFGFVGILICIFLWPFFFILNATKYEVFEWPKRMQWLYLILNGLIGTVLSELFWLWGCFLTSSLVGTLSLSLTIPLTMLADVIFRSVKYKWTFYIGSIPVFISFFAVTLLSHFENYDPVLLCIKKLFHRLCRRNDIQWLRDNIDREQTERLIIN